MRKIKKPPERAVRVAGRISTRVGIKWAIKTALIHLIPVSSPLAPLIPLFTFLTLIVLSAWLAVILMFGIYLGPSVGLWVYILFPKWWWLALLSVITTWGAYFGLAIYVHVRLFRWWLRRLLR